MRSDCGVIRPGGWVRTTRCRDRYPTWSVTGVAVFTRTLDSESLHKFAAVEGLGSLTAEPLDVRLERIARLARRSLNAGGVLVSWRDEDGRWLHCGCGPVERVAAGGGSEPEWLEPLASQDQWVRRDDPQVPYLTAIRLADTDRNLVGAFVLFDETTGKRGKQDHDRMRDYAAWVETELRVQHLYRGQERLLEELYMARHQALKDHLTRLWNRHAMVELMARELQRAEREVIGTGLLIGSVDQLDVNVAVPDPQTDALLKTAADRMTGAVRPYDALGKFGGNEFLVMLPSCPADAVTDVADRMLLTLSAQPVDTPSGPLMLTMSMGTAHAGPNDRLDPEDLIRAADIALGRAREAGGNTVVDALSGDYQAD